MRFARIQAFGVVAATTVVLTSLGCKPADSGDGNATTVPSAAATPPSEAVVSGAVQRHSSPADAVSHFLEALKAGDEARATSMLTTKAQAEMVRTDAAIKPPGSPTAQFSVSEIEYLGEQQTGAHVLSTWIDADDEGAAQSYEIVWILRKENEGWAIAGMATRVFDDQDPLILNFEDPLDAQQKRSAVDQEIARRNQTQQIRNAEPPTLTR